MAQVCMKKTSVEQLTSENFEAGVYVRDELDKIYISFWSDTDKPYLLDLETGVIQPFNGAYTMIAEGITLEIEV